MPHNKPPLNPFLLLRSTSLHWSWSEFSIRLNSYIWLTGSGADSKHVFHLKKSYTTADDFMHSLLCLLEEHKHTHTHPHRLACGWSSPCTTPHGYCLALTVLFPTLTSSTLPTTAKGRWACTGKVVRVSKKVKRSQAGLETVTLFQYSSQHSSRLI